MQGGWIKQHRSILDTDLWHDVSTYRLYTYLLLKATHQDYVHVNGLELKKGQWIRSYRQLAQDLSYKEGRGLKAYSPKTIKKCVDKLIKAGTITIQETELGTLFTVLEYASYQGLSDNEKQTGNRTIPEQETNRERSGNNNKKAQESNKANNNIKDKRPKSPTYDESSVMYQLSNLLFERIQQNNPDYKKPNLQTWAKHIDLMIRRDGRTPEDIRKAIEWAQSNDFWWKNILSTEKLRKQYDTITSQMRASTGKVTQFRRRDTGIDSVFQPGEESLKRMKAIQEMTPEESAQLDKQIEESLKELPF